MFGQLISGSSAFQNQLERGSSQFMCYWSLAWQFYYTLYFYVCAGVLSICPTRSNILLKENLQFTIVDFQIPWQTDLYMLFLTFTTTPCLVIFNCFAHKWNYVQENHKSGSWVSAQAAMHSLGIYWLRVLRKPDGKYYGNSCISHQRKF